MTNSSQSPTVSSSSSVDPAMAGEARCQERLCHEFPPSTRRDDDRPLWRKRRRSTNSFTTVSAAYCVVVVAAMLLGPPSRTWHCQGSVSSSWGTNFVLTRLDHTEWEYCQGQLFVVLVNPDPRQSASVQIESSQRLHRINVPPSDQVTYEDVGCPSLLDDNHDEIPDARQYDTTTPENVTRILPSFTFLLQIRSSLPIQAYASTRNSMDDLQDQALLLPTDAWGNTYRLLDFASTSTSPSSSSDHVGKEGSDKADDNIDDDGSDNGSSVPRPNRTRYTSFGIVAMSPADGTSGGRSTTTSVYLRNDLTGQESVTYELASGQVLWYRSPTMMTVATSSSTSDSRQEQGTKSDGNTQIGPSFADDGGAMDDSTTPGGSNGGYNGSSSGLYDITGWHVVASQPVAVFVASYGEDETVSESGVNSGPTPRSVRFQTFQQLVPESALGSTYMVCPVEAVPAQGANGTFVSCTSDGASRFEASCQDPLNRIRYIATQNNTVITLRFPGSESGGDDDDGGDDGSNAPSSITRVHLESAGQFYDLETTMPHHVMSNFPLYVYQSLVKTDDQAAAEGGDAVSDLQSSSVFVVPSMDQLLSPVPPSSTDGQPSPTIRVAVQHDQSSLRILHAQSNRVSVNDKWVVGDSGVNSNDDGMYDDQLYRTVRQQRRQRQCRSVGVWKGIEYCCTQVNKVSAGMYTIAPGPSSQTPADVAHPIGISVMTVSNVGSFDTVKPKVPARGEFVARFFHSGITTAPDPGGSSTSNSIGGITPTNRPTAKSPPTSSPSRGAPSEDDSTDAVPSKPSRRVFSYSGGMLVQDAPAVCSTGGPYQKRVFHFPSPNFELSGMAACANDAVPALVTWSSSDSSNVVFSNPSQIETKARFRQPGLYTLCMAVRCQDDAESGGTDTGVVTCCTTFEAIQDECDAGGPYRVEVSDRDLPVSVPLNGAVDTCEDGTAPTVSWFHNATAYDSRKDDVSFAQPIRLEGSVSVSSFGAFQICLNARCGESDLLHYQCCARLRVRELLSASGRMSESFRSVAPSELVQPSPTSSSSSSSSVDRPSRRPSVAPPRADPVADAGATNSSATVGRNETNRPSGPNAGTSNQTDRADPERAVGLATDPELPSSTAPSRSHARANGPQGNDRPAPRSSPGRDNTRTKNGGNGGGGGGGGGDDGGNNKNSQNSGDHRPGRDKGRGDGSNKKKVDRDSFVVETTTLRNIFFRGG